MVSVAKDVSTEDHSSGGEMTDDGSDWVRPDSAPLAGDWEQWEVLENSIAVADPLDTIDANEYQIIQTVKKTDIVTLFFR